VRRQQHGRSDKWIQLRMMGQETRNKLTEYWPRARTQSRPKLPQFTLEKARVRAHFDKLCASRWHEPKLWAATSAMPGTLQAIIRPMKSKFKVAAKAKRVKGYWYSFG
jgi:hypothetical protein